MKFKILYEPTGKAKEYGDLALNLYNGCPHACVYCYSPLVLKKDRETFHKTFEWRDKVMEKLTSDLVQILGHGKHIHLCFTCDPFPMGDYDSELTLWAIQAIHDSGNFVQILTKGEIPMEVINELCRDDIIGVTISCGDKLCYKVEPNALNSSARLQQLKEIKQLVKCRTFVSCEPVFEEETIYKIIRDYSFIDEYKIGKLNYMSKDDPLYPNIDWGRFGKNCEYLCQKHDRKYYIKESLREEMNKCISKTEENNQKEKRKS